MLANRAIDLLDPSEQVLVEITPGPYTSGQEMLGDLTRLMGADPQPGGSWRDQYRAIRRAREATGRPVVLVLDRFDRVRDFDDAPELLESLRELVSQPRVAISALIVSRRSLDAIEEDVRGVSTIASVCSTEMVGPLSLPDLEQSHGSVPESELREALRWGSGLAELVDYRLKVGEFFDSEAVLEAHKALKYNDTCRHLGHTDLLSKTIQWVLGPVWDEGFGDRERLRGLGILSDGSDRLGLAQDEVFRNALVFANRNLEAWGILGQAEMKTRSLVEHEMREIYNAPTWWEKIPKAKKNVRDVLDEAKEQQAKDLRTFGRQPALISCTYPSDLWVIISAHWDHFGSVMGRDKAYWTQIFQRISRGRNPYAHHKQGEVLSAEDRISINESCRALLHVVEMRLEERTGTPPEDALPAADM